MVGVVRKKGMGNRLILRCLARDMGRVMEAQAGQGNFKPRTVKRLKIHHNEIVDS